MFQRHVDMGGKFDDDGVRARIASTADMMEAFAVLAFSRAAQNLGDAAPSEDQKINPYAVSLNPGSSALIVIERFGMLGAIACNMVMIPAMLAA